MSAADHGLRVHPPIGGYVFAAMAGLYALVAPVSAGLIALEGDPVRGLLALVVSVPVLVWMAKGGIDLNRRVRAFRRRCRRDHGWVYSLGVVVRLAYVAFVGVVVLVDLVVLGSPVGLTIAAAVGLLLMGSMASVFLSAVTRAAMQL